MLAIGFRFEFLRQWNPKRKTVYKPVYLGRADGIQLNRCLKNSKEKLTVTVVDKILNHYRYNK